MDSIDHPERRQSMKMRWTEVAMAAAFAAAACAAIYAGLVRALRRAVAERQQTADRQLRTIETAIETLQLRVAELDNAQVARAQQSEPDAAGSSENRSGGENKQIKSETLAVITAAAATFLGRKARVRSAQQMPDNAGAWAQQGRVIVQTSHNLRPRA
jgi:hypothetical protein